MTAGISNENTPQAFAPGPLPGKRVAVVVFSHYPSDPRPRRAAELLQQRGMQVEVICIKQNQRDASQENFQGVRITRLPVQRRRGGKLAYVWQYASFLLSAFFLLAGRSLRRRFHLVHIHNMPDVLVFSALVPKLLGARVILDLHDPMPELMMTIFGLERKSRGVRLLNCLEKLSMRFADAVLAVNLACKHIFSARSCPAAKVTVIMNSPDENIFKFQVAREPAPSGSAADRPFIIMYHGSLVERHGLDLAVKALERVRSLVPNVELRVYGQNTPFLEQVMLSVRDTPLQSAVRYFGPRKLEEIVAAIGECDLGIIPNRRSIFTELNTPTRIFEYLSQGKPVLAPSAPGIQDYFGPGELLFFKLGDERDLADQILYAFSHPDETARSVQLGQAVYLDHVWSRESARFVELVESLMRNGAQRSLETSIRGRPVLEVTNDRSRSSIH